MKRNFKKRAHQVTTLNSSTPNNFRSSTELNAGTTNDFLSTCSPLGFQTDKKDFLIIQKNQESQRPVTALSHDFGSKIGRDQIYMKTQITALPGSRQGFQPKINRDNFINIEETSQETALQFQYSRHLKIQKKIYKRPASAPRVFNKGKQILDQSGKNKISSKNVLSQTKQSQRSPLQQNETDVVSIQKENKFIPQSPIIKEKFYQTSKFTQKMNDTLSLQAEKALMIQNWLSQSVNGKASQNTRKDLLKIEEKIKFMQAKCNKICANNQVQEIQFGVNANKYEIKPMDSQLFRVQVKDIQGPIKIQLTQTPGNQGDFDMMVCHDVDRIQQNKPTWHLKNKNQAEIHPGKVFDERISKGKSMMIWHQDFLYIQVSTQGGCSFNLAFELQKLAKKGQSPGNGIDKRLQQQYQDWRQKFEMQVEWEENLTREINNLKKQSRMQRLNSQFEYTNMIKRNLEIADQYKEKVQIARYVSQYRRNQNYRQAQENRQQDQASKNKLQQFNLIKWDILKEKRKEFEQEVQGKIQQRKKLSKLSKLIHCFSVVKSVHQAFQKRKQEITTAQIMNKVAENVQKKWNLYVSKINQDRCKRLLKLPKQSFNLLQMSIHVKVETTCQLNLLAFLEKKSNMNQLNQKIIEYRKKLYTLQKKIKRHNQMSQVRRKLLQEFFSQKYSELIKKKLAKGSKKKKVAEIKSEVALNQEVIKDLIDNYYNLYQKFSNLQLFLDQKVKQNEEYLPIVLEDEESKKYVQTCRRAILNLVSFLFKGKKDDQEQDQGENLVEKIMEQIGNDAKPEKKQKAKAKGLKEKTSFLEPLIPIFTIDKPIVKQNFHRFLNAKMIDRLIKRYQTIIKDKKMWNEEHQYIPFDQQKK